MLDAGGAGTAEDGIRKDLTQSWLRKRALRKMPSGQAEDAEKSKARLTGAESSAELFFQCGDDTSGEIVDVRFGQRGFAALENNPHEK